MKVIGLKCCYVGSEALLRGRRLTIVGVLRGSSRRDSGSIFLETEDEELEHEPVLPEELVRVRIGDTREVADVRATDLDTFHYLAPRTMKLDVHLEEATAQALIWAARTMGRPLDLVINDAVAAHVLKLGVGRTTARTLVGIPAAH
jgi:hypothetical protein